jgi:hypothetical protein
MFYAHPKFILIRGRGSDATITIHEKDSATTFTAPREGPFISDEMLLLNRLDSGLSTQAFYAWNFKRQQIVWETSDLFREYSIIDGFLFVIYQNDLCRLDSYSGEVLWRLDLGKYNLEIDPSKVYDRRIKQAIGIFDGVFFIQIGVNIILGVDVLSGKEAFRHEYDRKKWFFVNLSIDKSTGTLFNLGYLHYFELHIPSGQFEIFPLAEQTKKFQIETNRIGGWQGDRIYFWEGSTNNRFAIFERSSRSIIDVGVIEERADMFPAIRDIKYWNHKIYVLDPSETLNIFEE